jgi:hypothetical protein
MSEFANAAMADVDANAAMADVDANTEDDDDEDDGDWDPENEDDGDEEDDDSEGSMDSDDDEPEEKGVTADLNSAVIGEGGYKTVYLAEETYIAHIVGFKYLKLIELGGSDLFTDYVIVTFSPKYDAQRLLEELELQNEFAIDGLAPIVFALEIYIGGTKYTTVYGIDFIIAELKKLLDNLEKANEKVGDAFRTYIQPKYGSIPSIDEIEKQIRLLDLRISHSLNSLNKHRLESRRLELVTAFPSIPPKDEMETIEKGIKMIEKDIERSKELRSGFKEFLEAVKVRDDIEHASFNVLMQRTDYFTVDRRPLSGPSTIPISAILNYKNLNALLYAILKKKLVLLDIKIENLCIINGHLGGLDYDLAYVKESEYYAHETHLEHITGKQFMAMMVCLVGSHRELSDYIRLDILQKMGIITMDARGHLIPNITVLGNICLDRDFEERIVHYLVPKKSRGRIVTIRNVVDFIANHRIKPLITHPRTTVRKTVKRKGGKSATNRRPKPKPKKTRKKRSLVYHNLTR